MDHPKGTDTLWCATCGLGAGIWATPGLDVGGWLDLFSFGAVTKEEAAAHKVEVAKLARDFEVMQGDMTRYLDSRIGDAKTSELTLPGDGAIQGARPDGKPAQ